MPEIVTIEKMVAGGICMPKINGKNVFVPYTIPGEKVSVEIKKSFRDYDTAFLVSVIEPSKHRVEPFCPLYGVCGGCNMQHISPAYQTELRKEILRESFLREGLEVPEIEVVSGSEKGYRARIQLTNGGFNKRESNEIVQLDFCPVATKEINDYLARVPQNKRPPERVHIFGDSRVIAGGPEAGRVLVAKEGGKSCADEKIIGKNARQSKKSRLKKNTHFMGSVQDSSNTCSIELCGKKIDFDARGFFQSNLDVLEKSIEKITENIGGKNVLDM